MNSQSTTNESRSIEILLDHILKIPGHKIVTLVIRTNPFTIDIDATGKIGYELGHKELFLAKLYRCLLEGAGMTIRQFLSIKVLQTLKNGEKMWIPEKNLYGVFLYNGEWKGLHANDVQESHETDFETGAPLPRKEGIHYQTFPMDAPGAPWLSTN